MGEKQMKNLEFIFIILMVIGFTSEKAFAESEATIKHENSSSYAALAVAKAGYTDLENCSYSPIPTVSNKPSEIENSNQGKISSRCKNKTHVVDDATTLPLIVIFSLAALLFIRYR